MTKKKLLRNSMGSFFQHWLRYSLLIIFVNIVIIDVILPITNWLMSLIMTTNGIPYLSYNNLMGIVINQPLAMIEIFVLIVFLLVFTFIHFAFLLNGISYIKQKDHLNWLNIIKITLQNLKKLTPYSFVFYLFYFVLILPLSGIFFNSPFLSKLKVPTFILEFISTKPMFTILLILGYAVVVYIGIRLILSLPLTIIGNMNHGAAHQSWRLTKKSVWSLAWRETTLIVGTSSLLLLLSTGLFFEHTYFDHQTNWISISAAVTNMELYRLAIHLVSGFNLVVFIIMLLDLFGIKSQSIEETTGDSQWRLPFKVGFVMFIAVFIATGLINDILYLDGSTLKQPLTISHRGVDNGNGVQNTIPALEKTSKEKPDYIEMDIHETKDNQFVVMHDENLETLAGVNKKPHDLALKELKRITVHENGYTAKVASFDDYLLAAEKKHQKLLIEIKTTKFDSKNMTKNFINKYGDRILRDHDRIHSLDYHVIAQFKKQRPQLFASYILPFNLTFPETKANAYTMEETTLSEDFVKKAHQHKQKVYAWTVNDYDDMSRMIFLNVDGIITDNLKELKETLAQNFKNPSYASRFANYSENLRGNIDITNSNIN